MPKENTGEKHEGKQSLAGDINRKAPKPTSGYAVIIQTCIYPLKKVVFKVQRGQPVWVVFKAGRDWTTSCLVGIGEVGCCLRAD